MKTDTQLKMDITSELEWDPTINAANVGVAVKEGVVTLTVHLDSYAQRHAIERAVQRVAGLRTSAGVVFSFSVMPPDRPTTAVSARTAFAALARWSSRSVDQPGVEG
ncbi:MAG: BON domain-containing protein [Thiobacillus sp.]